MQGRARYRRIGLALLAASLLLGALSANAWASEGAPTNSTPPTISTTTPYRAQQLSATPGTWTSEAPVHWSTCNKKTGGAYASAACEATGSPNEWELAQPAPGEEVSVTAHPGASTFNFTYGGVKLTLSCEAEASASSIKNPSGGGSGTGKSTIGFKNCAVSGKYTAGCKAAAAAASPDKLELRPSAEGTEVRLSAAEGSTITTFTFSGCTEFESFKGPFNLTGTARGLYSGSLSQAQFSEAKGVEGELFLNGVSTRATATVGFETSTGGHLRGDSITYGYAWSRCKSTCETIAGANASTYTPVSADVGSRLLVSVTATNSSGSTTAKSAETGEVKERLSWYSCNKATGAGVYEDANCTKKGSSNSYEWVRPIYAPLTTTATEVVRITYTIWGTQFKLNCSKGSGGGTLANGEAGAAVEAFKASYESCYFSGGLEGCAVSGSKLAFGSLKGESAKYPSLLNHEVKFQPSEAHGALLSFNVEGCASVPLLNGEYVVTGYLPAQVANGQSLWTTSKSESEEHMSVAVHGVSAPFGFEARTLISSEGKSLKLDVAP